VKDSFLRSFFLILGIARGLSSTCFCRFTSLTPPGAPTPSAGAPPGSPSTRARSFASPSAPAVASGSARHGEQ
jgi:hypothetical protein